MEATKTSNFSIDHILGTEFGPSFPTGAAPWHNIGSLPGGLGGLSNGFNGNLNYDRPMPRPLTTVSMVPVFMPHSFDYNNSYLGYGSYNYQRHHHDLIQYPNTGLRMVLNNESGSQSLHYLGQTASQRQRVRMRTVFTDSQSKRLEQQFQLTDYPCQETRAQLARDTGLTEETVRVWFKNRRARRKRQRSKVKSPSAESRRKLEDGHHTTNYRLPLPRALR